MYSATDVDDAVAAGAMSPASASDLRRYMAEQRSAPAADEEQFRLLTGFNDIFVSIALALLLSAVAGIGGSVTPALGGAGVAGAAWFLAECFTAKRRMALPSIILLLTFVGGAAATLIGLVETLAPDISGRAGALAAAGVGLASAAAAWTHWRRFAVPITVAAGAVAAVAVAAVGVVLALAVAAVPGLRRAIWLLVLPAGLAVFPLAMRWDLSDRERRTRRADVAFWLHLAAAPLIAHSLIQIMGVFSSGVGPGTAVAELALYLVSAVVALAIARRALLVSGLAYTLYALIALFRTDGGRDRAGLGVHRIGDRLRVAYAVGFLAADAACGRRADGNHGRAATARGSGLVLNRFHQPPLQGREHAGQLVPAL